MICDTQFVAIFVIYDTVRMGANVGMPINVNARKSNGHKESQMLVELLVMGVLLYQLCVGAGKFLGAMLTCYSGSP